MGKAYNELAGRSRDRLAALSDGIFAVAMTLLVLDLYIPVSDKIRTEHDLWTALLPLSGTFLAYFMSFLTLGIFWLAQQAHRVPHCADWILAQYRGAGSAALCGLGVCQARAHSQG